MCPLVLCALASLRQKPDINNNPPERGRDGDATLEVWEVREDA
jgi:hypothetical protein